MELLKRLYKISSKSGMEDRIKSFVLDCVSDVNLKIDTDDIGNLFITKGLAETYPCVAAHLDVVELKMRGLEIPVCNIGCGYYEAHKSSDILQSI